MAMLFNYLLEDEQEVTLKNARRIILCLIEENTKLKDDIEKESAIKNDLYGYLIAHGLLDDYESSKETTPVNKIQAINIFAHSLQ